MGDVIDFTLFIKGENENQIGFKIIHPTGQKDFGNINQEFRSTIIAEASGDHNFEFDNNFSNASDKQIDIEFSIKKTIFNVYVEAVPSWAEYVSGSIESSIDFWKFTDPKLEFIFVDSPQQADFTIQFVKEFGTEHLGYAAHGVFVEVGLGDSRCRENWQPYSEKYISQIIAHEIGHVLDLEHVDDPENIMYQIGDEREYGLVEEEFVVTSGYGQFIPICTTKDLSAFRFIVETDDPKYGIDVYTIPSKESFDNWSKGNSFYHYTPESCSGQGMLIFSGICEGLARDSGLLILTDKEQTNSLTRISVEMQEIPLKIEYPQETILMSINRSEIDSNQESPKIEESNSEVICGEGTVYKNGQCVPNPNNSKSSGGGCLIATATYGSELAPQVQQLRELRDNQLLKTESGISFINTFNDFYYSFSPQVADYERENPVFKEAVKLSITPMISSLLILNHVEIETDVEVLGYGISLILLNFGMYVGIPIAVVIGIRKKP